MILVPEATGIVGGDVKRERGVRRRSRRGVSRVPPAERVAGRMRALAYECHNIYT